MTSAIVNSGINLKSTNNRDGVFNLYRWCKQCKPTNESLKDFYIKICFATMTERWCYSQIPC